MAGDDNNNYIEFAVRFPWEEKSHRFKMSKSAIVLQGDFRRGGTNKFNIPREMMIQRDRLWEPYAVIFNTIGQEHYTEAITICPDGSISVLKSPGTDATLVRNAKQKGLRIETLH